MGLLYYCFSDVCRKEVTCLVSLCSCHGDSKAKCGAVVHKGIDQPNVNYSLPDPVGNITEPCRIEVHRQ